MLTLFTIPKAFRGHIGVIQTNAISSWVRLGPDCDIILLGSEEGTAELAARLHLRHLPEVARNEYGTPLLDSIFQQGEAAAASSVLGYVNADIILTSDFLPAVRRVLEERWPSLMIGRRWDADLRTTWNFDQPGAEERLRRYVHETGRLHAPYAMDYFVFPKGLWSEIPPFAIGRTLWDNWLVYRALAQGVPVIDATAVVTAIHQQHDYAHAAAGEVGAWQGPEARRNLELLGGIDHIYDLRDATWALTPKGIAPVRDARLMYRRLVHAPVVRSLIRPLRLMKRTMQEASRRDAAASYP